MRVGILGSRLRGGKLGTMFFKNQPEVPMDQVDQEFGQPNRNAPVALSRFAFLLGRWRCKAKVRPAEGEWQTFDATWLGRFILGG